MAEYNSDRTGANIDATLDKVDVRETVIDIGSNTANRITIDSSGNLLVGKTAFNINTVGTQVWANGELGVTKAGGPPVYVNRTTSDGDIQAFMKDGTTVGSIGTKTGTNRYLTIGGSTGTPTGLIFDTATASIGAWNVSTNSGAGDTIDLGYASRRFKDLYLSGGVYLGGTGSANKLDDYEEGTWTPVLTTNGGAPTGVTYSFRSGSYTKIGNVVYFRFGFYLSGITSTGSGEVRVSGLPFSGVDTGAYQEASFAIKGGNFVTSSVVTNGLFGFVVNGNPLIQFRVMTNADTVLDNSEIQANTFISATGFYHTTA